ncbi:putative magnesium transporter NIPA4 [Psilocybe cubensis]|uniref:Magnesium transporter NIPA4 n=1 Tax=Psilocybe cubensis TaxID=181762 RepID=A0ACB8GQQ0_PSICU|nr:putative magnesium transporter NIPA4 [Psilocybe cubensis]KAH9477536.1 putative magnesium transporter NIPA4 [Psilocybe cubensis]
MEDKYIGLVLALLGSVLIGSSFIITKKGLNDAATGGSYGAQASDNLAYFKNPIWWLGMVTIANFAAYTFAPPILVTPLGALSVLIGAVLASFLLGEELGHLGRIGCTLCLLGSLIIVLHAPEDKPINTVDEILHFAIQPGFLLYCFTVLVFTLFMIYMAVPKYGRTNPIVYLSICSLVGSISVMAIKGFGVAVKLTFAGNNQFTHPSTYVFMIVVALSIIVQMNYFNKALDTFSTNVVNPLYYVGFSSCTIVASLILFQGFNTSDASNTFSLLSGFIVTFLGVHLLNLSRTPEPPLDHLNGQPHSHSALEGGLMNPRLSLQGRMSIDGWNGVGGDRGIDIHMGGVAAGRQAGRHGRQSSLYKAQSTTLFNAFEEEEAMNGSPSYRHQQHKRQPSADLHRLREAEEWEEDNDMDDDDDKRALLNKGKRRQNPNASNIALPLTRSGSGGSRSHSHSPVPDSSLTDVRITPRS